MAQSSQAGHTGAVSPVLRASLVAALLAEALATAGCSSPPACAAAADSCMSPSPPRVTFATSINGGPASLAKDLTLPSYPVHPGEHLLVSVVVTVPRHVTVTALWLGICHDSWGWGPGDRPTGMNPILAHSRQPLPAGVRTFGLRWRLAEGRLGASSYLCTAWLSHQPPAAVARAIAVLALN